MPACRRLLACLLACLVLSPCLGAAPGLLADPAAWTPQPDWLPNPSAGAAITRSGDTARLVVPEAGRGMKWVRPLSGVWLSDTPWLVVRYRAQGLRPDPDYFVWVQEQAEHRLLRLDQLQSDGQWHTLAVDVAATSSLDSLRAIALQMQAASPQAWIEIGALELAPAPPPKATISGQQPPPQPDWLLAERGAWEPQPTWLGNPASRPRWQRRPGVDSFTVTEPGRGMKWLLRFQSPLDPAPYRYLTVRLRGTGTLAQGDYAVCVLGDGAPDGREATVLAGPALAVTGGRWHTLDLPLGPARRYRRLVGLALQVQAGAEPASLEIAGVRLSSSRPPLELDRLVPVAAGWPGARHLLPLDLGRAGNLGARQARESFRLARWLDHERVTAAGLPFRVRTGERAVLATARAAETSISLPLPGRASELYLLVLARLWGAEEQARGGGVLSRLADPDRLRVALHYADGTRTQATPARPEGGFGVEEGLQVLTVRADPARTLRRLELYLGTEQAQLGLVAVTANTGPRHYERLWQVEAVPPVTPRSAALAPRPPAARLEGSRLVLENRFLRAELDLSRQGTPVRLLHRALAADCLSRERQPLFSVQVAGDPVPADRFRIISARLLTTGAGCQAVYRCDAPALEVELALSVADEPRLTCELAVRNLAAKPLTVTPTGPQVSVCLGAARDLWYLVPSSATLLGSRPVEYADWYSGVGVPLQFLDTYNPRLGGGVGLLVRDLQNREKCYRLRKSSQGVTLALAYQQRQLVPGEQYRLAPVDLLLHTGDWHAAYAAYQQWAATWYRPAAPRPPWWREVFNFRQRFLYGLDPLVDRATNRYRIAEMLAEADREFGGCEYLHLFDWGYCGPYGRIYGRTGDYDPGDYLPGGWPALRAAREAARERGLAVGFYIEGYLLEERGKLGQAHGPAWQMRGPDGSRLRWPDSTELYVCPAVPAWQQVQADTYARTVERLDADGMYLDELGFTGPGKWCWSADHGHRVPGSCLQAEAELTRLVRERISAVKPGAVLYTENTPSDQNSQYQDGSFSYSMNHHQAEASLVPLKLFRFAFPDLKNFEILYCDGPTATWATGVRWTFWNGEGLWLEGPAGQWFAPQTRRAIRDCHAVLRAHRAAFAGDQARPLVPTLAAGVYANEFTGGEETAYTLYNARPETWRGPVLALPHRPGTRYLDAFARRELTPQLRGGQAILSLVLDPQGVGCIVACR